MVWRSGRYQVFLIFDGVLTAGLAAMVCGCRESRPRL